MNSDFHDYNMRTSGNLHRNHHRLTRSLNSITHIGLRMYNKLSDQTREVNNIKFNKDVKQTLSTHVPFSYKS